MFQYRIVRHSPGGYRLERRNALSPAPAWTVECYAATRSSLRNYLKAMRQALTT